MYPYGLDLSYPPNIPWAFNIFTDSEPPFTWLIGVLVRGTPYPSLAPYWDLPAQQLDNQWNVLRAAFSGRTNERPGADFETSGPMTSLKKLPRMAKTHRQTDGRTWRFYDSGADAVKILFIYFFIFLRSYNFLRGSHSFFFSVSKKNWGGPIFFFCYFFSAVQYFFLKRGSKKCFGGSNFFCFVFIYFFGSNKKAFFWRGPKKIRKEVKKKVFGRIFYWAFQKKIGVEIFSMGPA